MQKDGSSPPRVSPWMTGHGLGKGLVHSGLLPARKHLIHVCLCVVRVCVSAPVYTCESQRMNGLRATAGTDNVPRH